MTWETITLYPGYTYQLGDVLTVFAVVLAVGIFGRMFWAP